jgi:hypothetical protein
MEMDRIRMESNPDVTLLPHYSLDLNSDRYLLECEYKTDGPKSDLPLDTHSDSTRSEYPKIQP